MDAFDKLGLDVASMLVPWIAILISISAAFWFKDFATNFMQGLKFRFNPAFNEGDEVLLDGEQSTIVKIGLRETVFGCYSSRGYTWRYVAVKQMQKRLISRHRITSFALPILLVEIRVVL